MIKTPRGENARLIKSTPGRAISQQSNMFDIPYHSCGQVIAMNRGTDKGKYYQQRFAGRVEGYQWK